VIWRAIHSVVGCALTFLHNHAAQIATIDLFVVPTIKFKLLYGLVILRLERRRLIWTNALGRAITESRKATMTMVGMQMTMAPMRSNPKVCDFLGPLRPPNFASFGPWQTAGRQGSAVTPSTREVCDFLRHCLQSPVMDRLSDLPAISEFGRFNILRHRRQLLAEGRPIPLGGRAFDLLLALVEASPGVIVGKDELLSRV
jgi:hypothetical protein